MAKAVVQLQKDLPNARIVYCSATGATEVGLPFRPVCVHLPARGRLGGSAGASERGSERASEGASEGDRERREERQRKGERHRNGETERAQT